MALTVLHDGAALENFTKEGDYVVKNPAELLPGTYVVTIRKGMDSNGVGFTTQHCTAITTGQNITRLVNAGGSGGSPTMGVNATPDTTNRLSVASDASLFSYDDVTPGTGDHTLRINKEATADTASVQFEVGESARAEIGLLADDGWRVKTSPNGATWFSGIHVSKDNGFVGIGTDAVTDARLKVNGALKMEGTLYTKNTTIADWSTFWSASGLFFATPFGYLGTNSGVQLGLIFNGYRTAGNLWQDLSATTGVTTGVAIEVGTGGCDFRCDTTVSGREPTLRMRLTTAGKLGVGAGAVAPTCGLQVDGAVRPKSYTVALANALSQATDGGSGALIYVSNESGGAVTAFSDGTNWRRVTDRAIIT